MQKKFKRLAHGGVLREFSNMWGVAYRRQGVLLTFMKRTSMSRVRFLINKALEEAEAT